MRRGWLSQRGAAVDNAAARGVVLVRLPGDRWLLVHPRHREVADAVGEDRLHRGPLAVRERDQTIVVVAAERPKLALVGVRSDRVPGNGSRRAERGDHSLAAEVVRDLLAVPVVAAVAQVPGLI